MIARPYDRTHPKPCVGFDGLGLAEAVLAAVREVGYETPSPIQLAAIPPLLEGKDLLGQAQTGTGKTAAFALPLLCRLDLKRAQPQLLVLTPTRELAIQVAEAMQTYARHLKGFHVLPVYGGQGMDFQLKQLRRGVHAVVGTPGRIQDHLRRKTLKLDELQSRRHRRGRRDAAHGLHRGRRGHLEADARGEAGGAVLGDVAGSYPQDRRAPLAKIPSR